MANHTIDRESIRSEFAVTRAAFHDLMSQVGPGDLKRTTGNSAWNIGDLLYHLVSSLELLPREVAKARKGKGMYNLPHRLLDPLNAWSTRLGARRETPATLIQRYERAYAASIDVLDQVRDDEWRSGGNFWGEGFLDIEGLFRAQTLHLAEHGPVIREALSGQARSPNAEERSHLPQGVR
jgi:hypothetical protein